MNVDSTVLGPMLAQLHQGIRRDLDGVLLAACAPDAGPWDRWNAVRMLDSELRPRLRIERELVHTVTHGRPAATTEQLWSLGELLEALGHRLCEVGRSGQRASEFIRTADKYRLALEYWCRAVEIAAGEAARALAPGQLLDRLEAMAEPAPAT
ncbi:MAG TPA: hypothetical protein VHJ69_00500 [Gemmatimonadales bacterium]|nr:hypothetical protein [Gemmatimonadales bacterium]